MSSYDKTAVGVCIYSVVMFAGQHFLFGKDIESSINITLMASVPYAIFLIYWYKQQDKKKDSTSKESGPKK